jgi:hypothetical protein
MKTRLLRSLWVVLGVLVLALSFDSRGADALVWRAGENRVDADLKDWPVMQTLQYLSAASGWHVFVEPGITNIISVKFKGVACDEALRRMFDQISYEVRYTNSGPTLLFVYRTRATAATLAVAVANAGPRSARQYLIANELVVKLKKDSKLTIEDLARRTNAKIVGRNDTFKIYRLQFPDAASAALARQILSQIEDVAWVDSNYSVDPPSPAQAKAAASGSQFNLNPKSTSDCSKIVGLIDTAVLDQPEYSQYMLTPISVVGDVSASDSEPSHGTAMLETMLSASTSSTGFKIQPVVVYSSGESTTTYEVAQGIVQAVNAGANPINLSLGGTGPSEFLHQLIKEATAKGIVFVAAAGNEPVKTATYPAAWSEVISVTASDSTGHIASYANSGDFVKAMASGTSIVSINGQLWQFEGTSVATARLTGILAGKASENCVTPSQLTDQVVSSLPVEQ